MITQITKKYLLIALISSLLSGLVFYEFEPLFRLLIGINFAVFLLCGLDKQNSIEAKERVPESVFFILSALGGSLGMILGMKVLKHKTNKASFQIIIITITVIQGFILYLLA